MIKIEMMQC